MHVVKHLLILAKFDTFSSNVDIFPCEHRQYSLGNRYDGLKQEAIPDS